LAQSLRAPPEFEFRRNRRSRLSLLHTAAMLLMADGVNIKTVREMLGHADLTTTL